MDEFEELVDAHYQPLYRFAYSLAKSADAASDLVQQTFCIWAEKGHQLKDRSKAKTWLFTTLYREHLAKVRRSAKFPEDHLDDVDYHMVSSTGTEAGRVLDGKRAVAVLKSLEEVYRAPLSLFFLQQHSYKEIAEILKIPIGTVMSRISRGKDMLKDRMQQELQGEGKVIQLKPKVSNG